MKNKISPAEQREWETTLARLGQKYDVTLQLTEVTGKRWSYLAGPTASTAGLMGMFREEIGAGLGVIIFPHSKDFSADTKQRLLAELDPESK